ncbi:hypothetical protein WG66_003944 [Moniliophthora roreri]|nr:hypothetical protein WG66_003944 [Moniliophthora roreri]
MVEAVQRRPAFSVGPIIRFNSATTSFLTFAGLLTLTSRGLLVDGMGIEVGLECRMDGWVRKGHVSRKLKCILSMTSEIRSAQTSLHGHIAEPQDKHRTHGQ